MGVHEQLSTRRPGAGDLAQSIEEHQHQPPLRPTQLLAIGLARATSRGSDGPITPGGTPWLSNPLRMGAGVNQTDTATKERLSRQIPLRTARLVAFIVDTAIACTAIFAILATCHFSAHSVVSKMKAIPNALSLRYAEQVAGPNWWQISSLRLSLYLTLVWAVTMPMLVSKTRALPRDRTISLSSLSFRRGGRDVAPVGVDRGTTCHHPDWRHFPAGALTLCLLVAISVGVSISEPPRASVVATVQLPEMLGRGNCTTVGGLTNVERDFPRVCKAHILQGFAATSVLPQTKLANLANVFVSLQPPSSLAWETSMPQCEAVVDGFPRPWNSDEKCKGADTINGKRLCTPPGGWCGNNTFNNDLIVKGTVTMDTVIRSGLLYSAFVYDPGKAFAHIYDPACSEQFVSMWCAVFTPLCRHRDCAPHGSCLREAGNTLAQCLNMTDTTLAEYAAIARCPYILHVLEAHGTAKYHICMIQHFLAEVTATMAQASVKHPPCVSKDGGVATPTVSCAPTQERTTTVEHLTNAGTSLPQQVYWNQETRAWALLGAMSAAAVSCLVLTGSASSVLETGHRSPHRKRILLVIAVYLITGLLLFVGGIQAELAPNGVPPRGSESSLRATAPNGDASDGALQIPPIAILYYMTSAASVMLCAMVLIHGIGSPNLSVSPTPRSPRSPRFHRWAKFISCSGFQSVCKSQRQTCGYVRQSYTRLFSISVTTGAVGKYFMAKLMLTELVEQCWQFIALVVTIESQERNVVLATFLVLGLSLISIPVSFELSSRFYTDIHDRTFAVELVELIFDKALAIVLILMRVPTIDALASTVGRTAYHGAPLIAGLMTMLTLRSAKRLLVYSGGGVRPLSHRVSLGVPPPLPFSTRNARITRATTIVLCVLGLALVAIPTGIVIRCDDMWNAILGDAVNCAAPQYVFADLETCGLKKVTALDCNVSDSGVTIRKQLPDSAQYELMQGVRRVHFGDQARLTEIPRNWRQLSNLSSIYLNNTQVRNLPWEICWKNGPKGQRRGDVNIILGASVPAAKRVSWRDADPPLRVLKDDVLPGCVKALAHTLKHLDITGNSVTTAEGMNSIDRAFQELETVVISRNGLRNITRPESAILSEPMLFMHLMGRELSPGAPPCPLVGLEDNNVTNVTLYFGTMVQPTWMRNWFRCLPASATSATLVSVVVGTVPNQELARLTRLTHLDVRVVNVLHTPLTFNTLTSLTYLKLLTVGSVAGVLSNDSTLPAMPRPMPPTLFSPLVRLRSLDMQEFRAASGQKFNMISSSAFWTLGRLRSLIMVESDMTTIPTDLFQGLTKLERLKLTRHKLTDTLPKDLFQGLQELRRLDLFANGLTYLPPGIFYGLTSLSFLSLLANPIDAATVRMTLDDGNVKMSGTTMFKLPALDHLNVCRDHRYETRKAQEQHGQLPMNAARELDLKQL